MIELYWLTRLCALHSYCGFIIGLSIVMTVCAGFVWIIIAPPDDDPQLQNVRKWTSKCIKVAFVTALITGLLNVFIPSKKELMVIIGGGAIYDYIQQSEEVKKLPDNVVKVLNEWLTDDDEKTSEK